MSYIQDTRDILDCIPSNRRKVLSGKQFKEWIDRFSERGEVRRSIIMKRLASDMVHHDYTYKLGLNVLKTSFKPNEECTNGGFYVTDDKHKGYFEHYGKHWFYVGIPDWALVYVESEEKYKCSSIYLDVEHISNDYEYIKHYHFDSKKISKKISNKAFENANNVFVDDELLIHMAQLGLFDPAYKPFMDRLTQLYINRIINPNLDKIKIHRMYVRHLSMNLFISPMQQNKIKFCELSDIIYAMTGQQFVQLIKARIITFDEINSFMVNQFSTNDLIELIDERYVSITNRNLTGLHTKEKIKQIPLEHWIKWIDRSNYINKTKIDVTVSHLPDAIKKLISFNKWMEWLNAHKIHIINVPDEIKQKFSFDQWINLADKDLPNYESIYFNRDIRFRNVPYAARTMKMWEYRYKYKNEDINKIPLEYRAQIAATTQRANVFHKMGNTMHLALKN